MADSRDITLFIDPPSHHFEQDALFDINKAPLNGDNLLAPYVYLREWFTIQGIRVYTADGLVDDDKCSGKNVYVSMGIRDRYRALARRRNVILSAFFALECPVVEPSLYLELASVQRYFKRVFSYSDNESLKPFLRSPLDCQKFYFPQSLESVREEIWRRENRGFMVMINANKLPRIYRQELYTERLRALEYFSRTGEIDLYGVGWDGPSYRVGRTWVPNVTRRAHRTLVYQWQRIRPDRLLEGARRAYRGTTLSKIETLGKYTFALCFENMVLNGWITEKIFDCFFAGTIPIYLGAPNIQRHVPPQCFVDMRHFANYAELATFLKSLNETEIRDYREKARAYLRSAEFWPFTKYAFVDLFRQIVEEDAETQLI